MTTKGGMNIIRRNFRLRRIGFLPILNVCNVLGLGLMHFHVGLLRLTENA